MTGEKKTTEERISRLERLIYIAFQGIRIGVKEDSGWGITKDQADEIRALWQELQEENT